MEPMTTFSPKKAKIDLSEWIKLMKGLVPNPKENHYYFCNDNIYIRYKIPNGNINAGHLRWHRLSSKETIELYINKFYSRNSFEDLHNLVHATSVAFNINLEDH